MDIVIWSADLVSDTKKRRMDILHNERNDVAAQTVNPTFFGEANMVSGDNGAKANRLAIEGMR